MRLTDLELYRWRFHNDIYIHTTKQWRPDTYPMMTWPQYWKEHGAFVSVLPRQTGKSTMLVTLAKSITSGEHELSGDYFVVCHNGASRRNLIKLGLDKNKVYGGRSLKKGALDGLQHNDIHLMVDEFEFIDMKNHLIHALNYPWKSVTMVSSLR